jgi:hypothetical protein
MINDGGPAFPVECQWYEEQAPQGIQTGSRTGWTTGMSLRDYFAAKAMVGYMGYITSWEGVAMSRSHKEIAEESYAIADAMIAARKSK